MRRSWSVEYVLEAGREDTGVMDRVVDEDDGEGGNGTSAGSMG